MHGETALFGRLRQLAEGTGERGGRKVPLRYGPVTGELAACMRSVGLIDREDLGVLRIEADAAALDRIVEHRFAADLLPGQARTEAGAHWGRIAPGEAIVVSGAGRLPGLADELRAELPRDASRVEEAALTAIGVIGPATSGLLTDLGVYETLAAANGTGAVAATPLAAGKATWILLDGSWALALVDPARALATWNEISAAGRRFGLCYVGIEAAERIEIVRRNGERACC